MSSFAMKMACDNDAFSSPDYPVDFKEVARILRVTAKKIEEGNVAGTAHDANGNRVGDWYLDLDEDEEE